MAEREGIEDRIRELAQNVAYRNRLIADPRTVVAEQGIELPDSLKITVVEESEGEVVLVLQPLPPEVADLSDAELQVSGGSGTKGSPWGTCGYCSQPNSSCTLTC